MSQKKDYFCDLEIGRSFVVYQLVTQQETRYYKVSSYLAKRLVDGVILHFVGDETIAVFGISRQK